MTGLRERIKVAGSFVASSERLCDVQKGRLRATLRRASAAATFLGTLEFLKAFRRTLQGQKGLAILVAVVAMAFLMALVQELTYAVTVEYVVNSQAIQRVKARAAARAGVEMSLLRIKLYQKAYQQFGQTPFAGSLNLIWSFPMQWPIYIPTELNKVDRELIQDKLKKSLMDATYTASIQEEGSKIDINDLGSPYKAIREQAMKRIQDMIDAKMKTDEKWAQEFRNFDYNKVLQNVADWVDGDTSRGETLEDPIDGRSNSGENGAYEDRELPPNRSFRTVDELKLVAGMTNEFFELLEPIVTIYGSKSINPNIAPAEVFLNLHDSMSKVVVEKILERRETTPFKDDKDFWTFARSVDPRTAEAEALGVPIQIGSAQSFVINAQGRVDSKISHEIEVRVFDLASVAKTLLEADQKQNPTNNPQDPNKAPTTNPQTPTSPNPQQPPPTTKKDSKIANGPPNIVDWIER